MEEEIELNQMEFDKFLIENHLNKVKKYLNDNNLFYQLKILKHKVFQYVLDNHN